MEGQMKAVVAVPDPVFVAVFYLRQLEPGAWAGASAIASVTAAAISTVTTVSSVATVAAISTVGIREGAGRAAALLGIIPFDGRADCPYRQAVLAFRSQTVQSVFGVIRADGFASVNRNFIVRCGFDCLPGEYQVIAALFDAFHLAHFQSLALVLSQIVSTGCNHKQ